MAQREEHGPALGRGLDPDAAPVALDDALDHDQGDGRRARSKPPVRSRLPVRSGPRSMSRSISIVQALDGSILSGAYAGGAISLPMTAVPPPTPIGMSSSPAPVTGPAFDVFVVTRVP